MFFKKKALHTVLAVTLALPLPTMLFGAKAALAEGPSDPAPFINAKVVNENAGKKVLFDNTHGQTAGAADWVIDGGFSDFGNALANAGYYVKELRKSTPITLADLQGYDVFIIGEANNPYKTSEQQAMVDYVKQGGSIFFIADHYNADRNKNRWDASEVFNGYRRGAWSNPAKGMSAEEAASAPMQDVKSSDWLADNFGVRFRYNALGDINATTIVTPNQAFGITQGVNAVAMHAGSTLAILDPTKAKGLVYLPKTKEAWASAVDQGVYNGGGLEEGPFSAVAKVGLGKAAFIGDSSPVEDATPKYVREENGKVKTTYDGFKEVDDGKYFVNLVNWLAKKESYTSLDQVAGLTLDQPTQLLPMETPSQSTEPQPEPWSAPDAGYKWWDSSTFKPGSYGASGVVVNPGNASYSTVHQAILPNAQDFQIRVVADNLPAFSTVTGFSAGVYLNGGTQVGLFQNADGTWPTSYNYSSTFSLTADGLGHAYKDLTVRIKPGTSGAANLRIRQNSNALKTETVTLDNVPAEPLPKDKPPVPAKISVSDARGKASGTLVTVEGVVTTAPGIFGNQAFYLQDETAGLYVFQNTAGFQVGDKVAATGSLALYNTELELADLVSLEKIGTANVPAPITVTALSEQNQGQLVKVENVKVTNIISAAPTGSFEFDAVNTAGVATHVRVDTRTGLTQSTFPYQEGQVLTISGVSAIFKGVYQLKPRSLADFASVDATAPVTQLAISGTPTESGWYNQDVTLTLTATDDSGVARTEYALAPDAWTTYTAPVVLSAEGTHTVQYRSIDTNGNVEAVQSTVINIDKTAPAVVGTISGNAGDNGWYRDSVQLVLSASDEQSGVQSVEAKVGNADWTLYTGPIVIATEGTTTVQYRAIDKAGNVSDVQSQSVQLDKQAPQLTLTQSGSAVHNVMADEQLSFNLTVSDALSGVKSRSLTLDGQPITLGAQLNAYSFAFGTHTVRATAVDYAGNVADVSYTFIIDTNLDTTQKLLKKFAANGETKNYGIQIALQVKLDVAQKFLEKGLMTQAKKEVQDVQSTLTTYAANGNVSKNLATVLNANLEYLLLTGLK